MYHQNLCCFPFKKDLFMRNQQQNPQIQQLPTHESSRSKNACPAHVWHSSPALISSQPTSDNNFSHLTCPPNVGNSTLDFFGNPPQHKNNLVLSSRFSGKLPLALNERKIRSYWRFSFPPILDHYHDDWKGETLEKFSSSTSPIPGCLGELRQSFG